MPKTKKELKAFNKDPVGWMAKQIEENLPHEELARTVMKTCQACEVKPGSKDFYAVLAFMSLMTTQKVVADFHIYRATGGQTGFKAGMALTSDN